MCAFKKDHIRKFGGIKDESTKMDAWERLKE